MTTVKQLLKKKGSGVSIVSPDATVFVALKLMAEGNIGALVVTKDDRIVGMFSERDYARNVILKERSSKETLVSEIMSVEVTTISPDETIKGCMEIFTEGHFRHLPVLEGEAMVGVISIGDAVKALISDQVFHIDQLESYITQG